MMFLKDNKNKDIIYQVAKSSEELEQALSLVYNKYASRGYIPNDYKSKFRISIYNALPSTTTFIAKQNEQLVATVTIIPDSPIGLPMDKLYKEKIDILRKQGRKIAEVSQLAKLALNNDVLAKNWFQRFKYRAFKCRNFSFILKLFKLVSDCAIYAEKLNDLCIAVNPRHRCIYKFLGFEDLGGLKSYGSVNGAPAVAMRLNLDNIEGRLRNRRGLYGLFFGKKTDPNLFKNKFRFTAAELKYFFLEKSNIFKKAPAEQLEYIKSCYPNANLEELNRPCPPKDLVLCPNI